jgi:hypothetical protein
MFAAGSIRESSLLNTDLPVGQGGAVSAMAPPAVQEIGCFVAIKRKLHDAWPAGYDAALRLWRSRFVWWIRSLPTAAHHKRLMAQNAPLVLVDIEGRMGLGAMLTNTLKVLNYCDRKGWTPYVRFTNPLYASNSDAGGDWLEQFFVRSVIPDNIAAIEADRFVPYNITIQNEFDRHLTDLSAGNLHDLFFKYMDIKSEIWREAREFCASANVGFHTLGVHYRGTDKKLEARRVGWQAMQAAIDAQLKQTPEANIFVATDEPEYLNFMRSTYGPARVADLDCKEIYPGSRAAHITPGDGRIKAKEALLSMLVLSMCGQCIRSPSHLSVWSKIIRPDLEMTILTQGYDGERLAYPENIIWRTSKKA